MRSQHGHEPSWHDQAVGRAKSALITCTPATLGAVASHPPFTPTAVDPTAAACRYTSAVAGRQALEGAHTTCYGTASPSAANAVRACARTPGDVGRAVSTRAVSVSIRARFSALLGRRHPDAHSRRTTCRQRQTSAADAQFAAPGLR